MTVALAVAQVAEVVKQSADEREFRTLAAEPVAALGACLVAGDQPRECERHVERVLDVVIRGVDRVILRVETDVVPFEVVKREPDRIERGTRIDVAANISHDSCEPARAN
jgi:hypothetical protein